ncbi:snRNA-activating protein complex subunit 4 isoform X2 [Triplophysa rosa]|uniref:snRNA-activating protein complex subunit 4 isoform X2 n=1 Tax=Triplophysa rosa TaxID=992332 RepID=UPI002546209E|nr:snRNA-activating protein complex subunit 4 isoform X2 [Triplophysa rosa]
MRRTCVETEQRTAQEIRAQKKRLVSLHQMRGMHPRCLICSVKSCKKVPQIIESEQDSDSSNEDSDNVELDLPQNVETCLQMNLVYQEVLKEKLDELEKLLSENRQQQKEIEAQFSGPSTSCSSSPGFPYQKLFLGYFMKPYFKDKLTGLGPPANEETKERMSHGTMPIDELKIKRWEVWQKALLTNAVAADTIKRMLQPKLSKLDYLNSKMSKAEDEEKEELKKQMDLIEKDIADISAMREEQLTGGRNDDHDWEKIANIDFEGLRHAEDLKRFWQNYLHPCINKTVWKQEEIDKLRKIVQENNCCHWNRIAEALGTNRTAFMCFQTYQRYISKTFRRKEWTKEEDQILRDLVGKMRIGNFIPYMQMSFFMVGRDASQLTYRWTSVLDPSIKKGPWSKEEDQLLRNAVAKYGIKEWGKIRMEVAGRTDGACRDRYLDCLQENVKKGPWSTEEVELLRQKVEKYGVGKWTKIASEIPNRVDCQCLNKWKQLNQAGQGKKRERQQKTVQQKAKRQKVIQHKIKPKIEITSSSEDETQRKIEYMDSDAEPEVPSDEDMPQETLNKGYVQPDMKEWIPVNATPLVCPAGTVRTMWVNLFINEDDPNGSNSGHNSSESSICSPVTSSPVRNTILDCFGNLKRIYVGLDATVLLNQAGNENGMIKVPVSDVKHLIQWKGASVMKKDKMKAPEEKRKRRQVRDWYSLNYELLHAITPWIGNVILPVPANKKIINEADTIGIKGSKISLLKTPVFSFFIKALHIDAEGCKNVIKAREKRRPRISSAEFKPKTVLPNTVLAALHERKGLKSGIKEPAELLQHPLPSQPVNPQGMITPALIHPNTLVIMQPNIQGPVQPFLLNGQNISLPPQSPPQAIPLPLIQLTAPVQPVTTLTSSSKSLSTESSKRFRAAQRTRKPTKKAQALIEEAEAKVSKRMTLKQNWVKQSSGVSTITLATQPINWIRTPSGLIQVTGVLSANIPGNQMLKVPDDYPVIISTRQGTSTNPSQNPLSTPFVTASSVSTDHLMPSSSINSTPVHRGMAIQTPLSNILADNKSMSPQASIIVQQKDSVVHTEVLGPHFCTKTFSDAAVALHFSSLSMETVLWQHLSCSSRHSSVSPATNNICVVPSTSVSSVPTSVSGPPDEVFMEKPQTQVFSQNICVPVTAIQSTVNQKKPSANRPLHHVAQSDLPSDSLSFDSRLLFSDHQSKVDVWINGKGGVSLPHLEITLPYLPPSAFSIKQLTSLLKAKQSLVTAAAKILTNELQNGRGEKEQVDATRKLVAERFATNPAYLRLKARFLSCFTFPALLATINPSEDCGVPGLPLCNNKDEVAGKNAGRNDQPPAARTELNTSEKALAVHFSEFHTKKRLRTVT